MKCDEVQNCLGPYLDSELDAKTNLEIQQHLNDCPECSTLASQQQRLDAWIKTGVNRGQKSDLLWQQLERAVAAGQAEPISPHKPKGSFDREPSQLQAFAGWVRVGWANSRLVWTGLAATWLAILVFNFDAPASGSSRQHKQEALSASDMSFALRQQKVLLAELTGSSESAALKKSKSHPAGPRSDGRNDRFNS